MTNKMKLHGSVLAIAAMTLIGMGLIATIVLQAVTAGPALTPFNFKVKECRVDTNPDPVSCKDLKHSIGALDINLLGLHVDTSGRIVITLTTAEPER